MDLGFLGGFSFAGKYYDHLPFEIIWANDNNKLACSTYELNLKHEVCIGDVASQINSLPNQADVLIGGFPCQDVSINGSRRTNPANGKRTILYRYMIDAIRHIQPRIFIAENVKGLLQTHNRTFFTQMLAEFEETGYRLTHRLYLAADFGVPQMRERLFLVGMRDNIKFIHPSLKLTHVPVQDVLHDLENHREIPKFEHVWSKAVLSPEQGNRRLVADKPATTIRAEPPWQRAMALQTEPAYLST